MVGCGIGLTLAGGIAPTRYAVILTAGTVSGRVLEYAVTIAVLGDADP